MSRAENSNRKAGRPDRNAGGSGAGPTRSPVSRVAGETPELQSWVSGHLQVTILDSLHEGVVLLDPEGNVVWANAAAARILGRPPGELADPALDLRSTLIRSDGSLFPLENQPAIIALRTGEPVRGVEMGVPMADGAPKWILCSAQVLRDSSGTTLGAVASFVDVSEVRYGEEARRRSNDWLALTQAAARAGSWDWDFTTGKLTWSAEFFDLFGLPRTAEPSFETWLAALHPDDREPAKMQIRQSIRDRVPLTSEYRVVRPRGEIVWIGTSGTTYHDQGGEPLRMCGICIDVTVRRHAQEALSESEARLREAQEIARLGRYEVDLATYRVEWSPSFFSLIEADPQTFQASYEAFLGFVHPDDRARVDRIYHESVARQIPYETEFRLQMGDGRVKWVNSMGRSVYRSDGTPVRSIGTVQDITERKRAEEHLRRVDKMNAIGQLAGGVAHDFNNQLTGILGYADLLVARLDDGNLKRYASNIRTAARRASDLTQQLLAFSRKGKYLSVPVDIHKVVAEVVALLEHSIDKRIEIEQVLRANPHQVLGDPTQLQNAILNLAVNARDAMPGGGILSFTTAVVHLEAEVSNPDLQADRYLRLCVTDTGTGMDAETLEHVFEPFFTTKEAGRGTGLGLAAVHGTIRSHRGKVEVSSEPGKGTTFSIFLPLMEQTEGIQDGEEAAEPVRGDAHILVVDDEELCRDLVADVLRSVGHRVTTCQSGEEAIGYYGQSWAHVDLVILDMVMPRLGGREVFLAVREINPKVKALLASGYSLEGEAQRILDEGVLGFVQKPFDRADLSRKVAEMLHRKNG